MHQRLAGQLPGVPGDVDQVGAHQAVERAAVGHRHGPADGVDRQPQAAHRHLQRPAHAAPGPVVAVGGGDLGHGQAPARHHPPPAELVVQRHALLLHGEGDRRRGVLAGLPGRAGQQRLER